MSQVDRIMIDPKIRHGRPVIKGTRVPVEIILGALAGGMSFEEVCQDYDITQDDILAALEYAARVVANEEIEIFQVS